MTFIKYTNDGKAVIQPAALTLSGLEQEETLEMHTLENAIVLLKQEMEPVEKAAAMMALMRLVNSLWADMLAGWEEPGGAMRTRAMAALAASEDMLPIPAEAFADAGILHDNLRVVSVDGAVLVVSDDRKTKWSGRAGQGSLEQLGIDRAGFEKAGQGSHGAG
ncbi:MAG: hypothetical protein V8Q30_03305 [Acutalibacteraceae bacterium]